MKIAFPKDLQTKQIRLLIKVLEEKGGHCWFVGGCVRDALLKKAIEDIDMTTDILPQEVIKRLKQKKIRIVPTGLQHGTVTAVLKDQKIEITTLREDIKTDGRHALVSFTTDREKDAARRDLTINAIYLSPEGEIWDPYKGKMDLKAGRIRFIGDPEKRIDEDGLRILRFFRFFARYGKGAMDRKAKAACIKKAAILSKISAERIRDEIFKTILTDQSAKVFKILQQTRILRDVCGDVKNIPSLERLVLIEKKYNVPDPLRRIFVIFEKSAPVIARMFKLSTVQKKRLMNMEKYLKADLNREWKKIAYEKGRDVVLDIAMIQMARKKNVTAKLIQQIKNYKIPTCPITAQDLIRQGFHPGPALGKELKKREQAWMEKVMR